MGWGLLEETGKHSSAFEKHLAVAKAARETGREKDYAMLQEEQIKSAERRRQSQGNNAVVLSSNICCNVVDSAGAPSLPPLPSPFPTTMGQNFGSGRGQEKGIVEMARRGLGKREEEEQNAINLSRRRAFDTTVEMAKVVPLSFCPLKEILGKGKEKRKSKPRSRERKKDWD